MRRPRGGTGRRPAAVSDKDSERFVQNGNALAQAAGAEGFGVDPAGCGFLGRRRAAGQ